MKDAAACGVLHAGARGRLMRVRWMDECNPALCVNRRLFSDLHDLKGA